MTEACCSCCFEHVFWSCCFFLVHPSLKQSQVDWIVWQPPLWPRLSPDRQCMNGVIAACGSWPMALHLLRWEISTVLLLRGGATTFLRFLFPLFEWMSCKIFSEELDATCSQWKMTRSGFWQLSFCAGPWREDNCVEMLWASMPRWKFWEFCLKTIDIPTAKKARINCLSYLFYR